MIFWFGSYENVLIFNFEVNEDGDNQSILTHSSSSMSCFPTSIKRKEQIGLTVYVLIALKHQVIIDCVKKNGNENEPSNSRLSLLKSSTCPLNHGQK